MVKPSRPVNSYIRLIIHYQMRTINGPTYTKLMIEEACVTSAYRGEIIDPLKKWVIIYQHGIPLLEELFCRFFLLCVVPVLEELNVIGVVELKDFLGGCTVGPLLKEE